MVTGRKPDLNSLLSSDKVSLFTREKTPRLCTENNYKEYEQAEEMDTEDFSAPELLFRWRYDQSGRNERVILTKRKSC